MAEGRLTSGRSKLPDEAVAWVARQVKVPASDIGLFDWEGRTAERLHSVIRKFTGFRESTVADAEKLTAWLAEEVCSRERQGPRVRQALLARMREERIEQPKSRNRISRISRITGLALRKSEEALTAKVAGRLDGEARARMWSLIAAADDDPSVPERPRAGTCWGRRCGRRSGPIRAMSA
jgi:hypothetical protein